MLTQFFRLQAVDIPVPVNHGGLYETSVYGPVGIAAKIMAVHAFSVARYSREVMAQGWQTTQLLAKARPQDQQLKANVAAWHHLRSQFKVKG